MNRFERAFQLIVAIAKSDVEYGFPSAQIAIMQNGQMLHSASFGSVTNDTLYDLASNTKMYATAYALQHLVSEGKIKVDTKISDIVGERFWQDTMDFNYENAEKYPLETQKQWKRQMTLRNVLCHRAGFPASPFFFHKHKMPDASQTDLNQINPFYTTNREEILPAICKMPLLYAPETLVRYSDVDYILLGLLVEMITGKNLQEYLSETFWRPMGLKHVTFNPLQNGFKAEDCAPTELHGNSRDGAVFFEGMRTNMIRGEVHDENAFYCMKGISGHAGLFANATDLAQLANLMLCENPYFDANVTKAFIAPVSNELDNWGLGWWRQGDQKRSGYFSPFASPNTVGHQGWTGTLTMIDPDAKIVMALLTNKIHSPVTDKAKNANRFDGSWYTTAALGFVAYILYSALQDRPFEDALEHLYAESKKQYQESGYDAAHRGLQSIENVLEAYRSGQLSEK